MEIAVLMFSMEFHGKCPNPPCKYFPWKSMEKFQLNSMEIDVLILQGIPWRIFHGGFSHGYFAHVSLDVSLYLPDFDTFVWRLPSGNEANSQVCFR